MGGPLAHDHGPLGRSIIRIWDSRGDVAGAGFLIGPRQAATCAHVVAAAIGGDPEAAPAPDGPLTVDFPITGDRDGASAPITAHVRAWRPILPDGTGDVAVLELAEPAPPAAQPPPMRRAGHVWDHGFHVLGFPAGMQDGVWASGTLRDSQGTRWVQLQGAANGRPITAGFSGAPVWDSEIGAVVGMVVAADDDRSVSTAYQIPIEQVLGSDPELMPNPYRGLEAFGEEHSAYFHGRDDDVGRLVDAVAHHPVVAVTGHSGVGKSSLVRAGLLARLRADGARIAEVRPSPAVPARAALAAALARLLAAAPATGPTAGPTAGDLAARLATDGGAIGSVAAEVAALAASGAEGAGGVLFLDQFEELAGESPAEARELLRLVATLIEEAGRAAGPGRRPLRVVLTLRLESIGELLAPDGPVAAEATVVALSPMNRARLREAIVGPAGHAPGLYFAPGLVERILDDAGTAPGQLPLVESLLTLLWERREGGSVTAEAYQRIGGVSGAVTRSAEEAIAAYSATGDRARLRRLFTLLARPDDDPSGADDHPEARFARRRIRLDGLPTPLRRLAQDLAASRLLVIGRGVDGAPTAELAHQALIDHWPRLRGWLTEDLGFLRWRDRLDQQLARWERAGRAPDLLLRGASLTEARRRLSARPGDHTAAHRSYIGASRGRRARRRTALVAAAGAVVVATAGTTFAFARTGIGGPAGRAAAPESVAGASGATGTAPPPGLEATAPDPGRGLTATAAPFPSSGPEASAQPDDPAADSPASPGPADPEPAGTPECDERRICFWTEENYTGDKFTFPIDLSSTSECNDIGFTARSAYNNSSTGESQRLHSTDTCSVIGPDAETVLVDGQAKPSIAATHYMHT
ncbi:trypsin-like peptidase domain-containing protein [Nocardiopsis sediminis]|uniref:Trypsin-like peptidase domain-containing protein n=1 Tax=Nocardiopsis sediminis TaxID=1778267 RepID=A0ABV8FXP3_9ACTN